jgi:excisionase family DNA binding protein
VQRKCRIRGRRHGPAGVTETIGKVPNSCCVVRLLDNVCDMEPKDDLLTIEEIAAKLRVNLDTVRRLLRQKKLPGVKIGAQWRVSAAALRAYIEGDMAERL